MAYALQFDGVNDYVTLSSMVGGAYADRVNVNQDWSLTFRFARAGASTYVHRLLSSTSGTSDELLMRKSDGLFRVTGLSGSHSWSGVPMPTTETEYRLERVVGTKQLELFVDSVSQGTKTGVVTIFNFDVVGVKGASGYVNGTLYYLSYDSVNSGASLYLDPSATGGTGSILEDTVGTNNGTLVNFPTDNSQWVRYDVFPTEFTRLGSLTTPSVTGSASDLPTLVKYEDFTSTMLASLDAGGGDLRFSSDVDGLYPLACEVVTFTKATGDVVWVKVPAVSTGVLIYVWGDNTGATQPAVGAAFGRNAVWSDFEVNYHFNSAGILIDATGNHDLTQFGSPTSATGQVGDAVDCAESYSNRFGAVGYKGIAGNSARTVTLWSSSSASQTRGVTTWGTLATGERYSIRFDAGRFRTEVDGSFKYTNTAVADGTFKRLSSVYDGTTWPAGLTHRTNGTTDVGYTSGSVVTVNTGSTADLLVGGYSNLNNATYGSNQTDEFAIRAFALSQEQDLIEYDNQSAVGAWWTATNAGGGGTVGTITQSTASFAQSLSGSVVNSYSGSIDQSTASFSQSAIGSVVIPAITGTIALSVASFAQSLSGNVVSSAVSGNITQTLSVFSQSLAGNTVLPGVVGVITQSTPAFTQSLVGSTAEQIAGVITQSTSRFTQSLVGSIPASWIDKPAASTAWSDNAAAVTVWTDK